MKTSRITGTENKQLSRRLFRSAEAPIPVYIRYLGMIRERRLGLVLEELQLFYLRLYVCRPLPLHPSIHLSIRGQSGANPQARYCLI